MIRAQRRALLRAVTANALRETDREEFVLTRRSDVRFRGAIGIDAWIIS